MYRVVTAAVLAATVLPLDQVGAQSPPPVVSFGGINLAVVEGSDDTFRAVLNVDPAPTEDITVRVETEQASQGRWSAAEGSDYTAASIDVPVATGVSSVFVEFSKVTTSGVRIADDDVQEDYEHFALKLRSGSGYSISGPDWLRVTIIDDEAPPSAPEVNPDGTYTVPQDWPLVPEELRARGGEFRLLLLTNTWRTAESSSIAGYDAHVRASVAGSHAGGSHEAIKPYAESFRVVGSTPTVDASDHIDAGLDAPIYWMNGPRVALNSEGFWKADWENWSERDRRTAASVSAADGGTRGDWHWTGTNADGTKHSSNSLGSATVVQGQYFTDDGVTRDPFSGTSSMRTAEHALLGISPVFRVTHKPRLEIDASETSVGRLGHGSRFQRMLLVDEPAACNTAPDDVAELGGVSHASDLATYRVRLHADPGGLASVRVYDPVSSVFRQGSLAGGPSETRTRILRPHAVSVNHYRGGLTVRPPGQPTTYASSTGQSRLGSYVPLYFNSTNWDQWRTVNLNIHCANHSDDSAYLVQHMVTLPGDIRLVKGGDTVDWSTWRGVYVKVIDTKSSQQPADLSAATAYAGTLSASLSPYPPYEICGTILDGSECEWRVDLRYKWATTQHPNDFHDATRHFSHFQVKIEGDASVSPPLPVHVYREDPSLVIRADEGANSQPYLRSFPSGLFSVNGSSQNPGDPVYRITITPVTIRNDDVPGEALTMCVQLQSQYAPLPQNKYGAVVDCSLFTAPAGDVPVVHRLFAMGPQNGPTVTISSDVAQVTEGREVTFTISADQAPATDTLVYFSVTEEMGAGANRVGRSESRFVTIPAGRDSIKVPVKVMSDDKALADGTVVGRILTGDAYKQGSPASVTLPLIDDDSGGKPEVSLTGPGRVDEGGDVVYTVSASPAPATDLDVSVTVSQSGDFGVSTGQRTVTVPTSGSATFTVATVDDDADETNGSVTAVVDAGSDYTVSASQGSASVVVFDDDGGHVVDAAVVAKVKTLASQTQHGSLHVNRWSRVLVAFGEHDGTGVTGGAMTAVQAQDMADAHSSPVWDEVVTELTALEAAAQPPPPTPVVSVSAGSGVTEGGSASFTVSASPAPSADLDATVSVSQSGDYGVTAGSRTVTVPASGSVTFTVATADDQVDEVDGSVSVAVVAGSGYTVSSSQGSATVAVADDDSAGYTVNVVVVAMVQSLASQTQHGSAHVNRWNRVLVAFGEHDGTGVTGGAMTAAQAQQMADAHSSQVWEDVVVELTALEAAAQQTPPPPPPPPPTSEVSVTANSGVTEGGDAAFTVTASPPPASALPVSVTVTASGDYGAATGQRTVTIPTSGSVTVAVGTVDDGADEPDGTVTLTVDDGSGYTVSATQGAATVSVADDDDPPVVVPVVSIGGGGVTEGGSATFTVSASPAPAASLDVTVTVAAGGDFGVAVGSRSVRIAAGQTSATLAVATAGDSADEPDGSVTVTIGSGSGYTVSATQGAATVSVADDDDPPVVVEQDQPEPEEAVLVACVGRPTLLISSPTASRSDQSVDFEVSLSCIPARRPIILLTPLRDGDLGRNIFVDLSADRTSTTVTVDIGTEDQLGLVLAWNIGLASDQAQGDVAYTD